MVMGGKGCGELTVPENPYRRMLDIGIPYTACPIFKRCASAHCKGELPNSFLLQLCQVDLLVIHGGIVT